MPSGPDIEAQANPAFVRRFLAALPPELAASYTPAQLAGVQRCFGMRHGAAHALDLRRSLWTPFGRVYVVLLAGPERRAAKRPPAVVRLAGAVAAAGVATLLLLVLLGGLHAAKLLAGIDVFPGLDVLPDGSLIALLRS
jgi:hypothetical protein